MLNNYDKDKEAAAVESCIFSLNTQADTEPPAYLFEDQQKAQVVNEQSNVVQIHSSVAVLNEVLPEEYPVSSDNAFYGVAGEIAKKACENSEADPIAVLLTCLVWLSTYLECKCLTGKNGIEQPARLFAILCGRSAKARKGTSVNHIKRIMKVVDDLLDKNRLTPEKYEYVQLSSGEGLIYQIRDESEETDKDGVPLDVGVLDKRYLVIDEEFGSSLRALNREGNTLSGGVRKMWDGTTIKPLTKSQRIKVTDPDVSILGHTTNEELVNNLSSVDIANGFGNRILWCCVSRSKIEPFPVGLSDEDVNHYAKKLFDAIDHSMNSRVIKKGKEFYLSSDAVKKWREMYNKLTVEEGGIIGSLIARSEPMVLRIALIFAVLDLSEKILPVHLEAAYAVWSYCESSVRYIFSTETNETEQKILSYLEKVKECSNSDITNKVFKNNIKAKQKNDALKRLEESGKIKRETVKNRNGGRPTINWSIATNLTN